MTKETQPSLCNITPKAALNYGSENWILKQRGTQKLEAAQMKCLRALLGLTTLDKIRNTETGERLNLKNTVREIEEYPSDWVSLKHVKKRCET